MIEIICQVVPENARPPGIGRWIVLGIFFFLCFLLVCDGIANNSVSDYDEEKTKDRLRRIRETEKNEIVQKGERKIKGKTNKNDNRKG